MSEHAFQDHRNFSTDGLTIVVAGVTLLSKTSATTKISSEGSGSITCSKSSMTSTYLEASWAPVHELNAPLALDSGDGGVDVLGHHVAAVQHAAGHVLAYQQRLIRVERRAPGSLSIICKIINRQR